MFKMKSNRLMSALRAVALLGASALAFAAWSQTMPSQVPLVSRVGSPPSPNVQITMDDSGSMQAHFMPEGSAQVTSGATTYTIKMPSIISSMMGVFLGDTGNAVNTYTYGYSTAVPGNTAVFQRQLRSSSVNSIFYNPANLYLPWMKADNSGRYPPAIYTHALWDPNPANSSRGFVNLGTVYTTANTVNWCSDITLSCPNSAKVYDPSLYYVLANGADPTQAGSYTEYSLNDGKRTVFPASAARVCTAATSAACCPATGCTLAEEQQNFANWFVYYHSRKLLMKGALSESLTNVVAPTTAPADEKVRVGFGTINTGSKSIDGKTSSSVIRIGMRSLDKTQLNTVLTDIQSLDVNGGTPLQAAVLAVGDYFQRDAVSDSSSPWRTVPGTTKDSATPLACRRSYDLMTTDGYYNGSPPAIGDIDSKNGPDYAGATLDPLGLTPTHYIAAHPYSDNQSNMLADYAMSLYVKDLQPNLSNIVPQDIVGGDLAYWQHLSMFTVGLGVRGTLDPLTSLPGLTAGTTKWTNDHIDDLWHAALDTHGTFFSAKDVGTLTAGLTSALGNAAAGGRSESGAATSATSLTTDTVKFLPSYNPVIWTGTVKEYSYNSATLQFDNLVWDAASKLPAATARNIYTWINSAPTTFTSDKVTTIAPDLVNYIRGDQSHEDGTTYRKRSAVLGDFIDSTPLFVEKSVNLDYDNPAPGLPSAPGYTAYFNTVKNARTSGVLFEGGNDGMLHAFGSNGVETYAYVPGVEIPNLSIYASTTYGSTANFHRDYVDGPQIETDAYIATRRSGLGWANLVVGSYGGGAPGMYVLDVTNLATLDSKTLLWELAGGSSGDHDLGYITSKIATGVLPGGGWKAFVGNGVDSVNGNAVLMVVDLASGQVTSRLTLSDGVSGANGLMGVKLVLDGHKQVVAAYAGDLHGNMWRIEFDASGTATVGFSNSPLFKAVDANGNAQPIVEAPAYAPSAVGNMVLFGTGQLINAADADSTTPQTFYGVWDDTPAGQSSAPRFSKFQAADMSKTERSLLVQQTITPLTGGFFQVSSNAVDMTKQYGWYMDLSVVSARQRVIYSPVVVQNYVLINTMAPGAAPVPKSCDQFVGTSAYFLLPAATGAASTTAPVWDTNNDGVIDSKDQLTGPDGKPVQAAGYSTTTSGGDTTILSAGNNNYRNVTGAGPSPGGPGQDPTFHIPLTTHQRVWQQLMTPPF